MKKGGWVSEVLHASAQQEVVRYGLAVRAQELEVNPRVPADSTEGRLFRELDRLARRDEHDAHLDGLVVLVRTTDRVVVVSEDDLRADSRQRELTREGDRRSGGVVAPGRGRVDVDGDRHRDVRAHRLLPDRVTRRRDGRRKAPRHEGHGKRRQPEAEHDQAHYGYSVVDVSPPPSGRPDPGIRDKGLGPAVNTQGPRVLLTPKLSRAKISRAWVRSTFDS